MAEKAKKTAGSGRSGSSVEGYVDGHNDNGEQMIRVHEPGGKYDGKCIRAYPNTDYDDGTKVRFVLVQMGLASTLTAMGVTTID